MEAMLISVFSLVHLLQFQGVVLVVGGVAMYRTYRNDAYQSYRSSAVVLLICFSIAGLGVIFGAPLVFK